MCALDGMFTVVVGRLEYVLQRRVRVIGAATTGKRGTPHAPSAEPSQAAPAAKSMPQVTQTRHMTKHMTNSLADSTTTGSLHELIRDSLCMDMHRSTLVYI